MRGVAMKSTDDNAPIHLRSPQSSKSSAQEEYLEVEVPDFTAKNIQYHSERNSQNRARTR